MLEELESIAFRYAHGECGAFAVAAEDCFSKIKNSKVSRLVVFHSDEAKFVHAALGLADGRFFDAYGVCSFSEIEARYSSHSNLRVDESNSFVVESVFGFDDDDVCCAKEHCELLLRIYQEHGIECSIGVLEANED